MNKDLPYWLALFHCPGIPSRFLHVLFEQKISCRAVLTQTTKELADCGIHKNIINKLKNPPWHLVEKDLAWLKNKQNTILTLADNDYPELLQHIHSPPPLLYIKGDKKIIKKQQIAIVGSRHASYTGLEIAEKFAESLTQHGYIITSGLALGIDSASHQAALRVGETIAVLGSGLDYIYPKRNQTLAGNIIHHGCLVSEFPPTTPPHARNFPQRNRIISGLAIGLLVIEASQRSGSLITARFAAEQGRDVFAIPGSINNPLSKGCHQLIKQGAKCVDCVDDILHELPTKPHDKAENKVKPTRNDAILNRKQTLLLNTITDNTTSIDEIIIRSGLSWKEVNSLLFELEMLNKIKTVPGGFIRINNNQ